MRRGPALAIALLSGALASGCASAPPPVVVLGMPSSALTPPAQYKETLRRYLRHGNITHDFDTAFDGDVVLLLPEFRAAWAGRLVALRNLPPIDAQKLGEDQQREAAAHVEAVVVMQASRWEWNDLGTPQSVWTITFHDDEGRSVVTSGRYAFDVKKEVLQAMFPTVTAFTRAWRVRFPLAFPDGTPLLRTGAKELAIDLAGPLGHEWFRWRVK